VRDDAKHSELPVICSGTIVIQSVRSVEYLARGWHTEIARNRPGALISGRAAAEDVRRRRI
jgi:hypothetical protein